MSLNHETPKAPQAIQQPKAHPPRKPRRATAGAVDDFKLLQAQRLHAMSQLAAGLAHEFNNLIAGILGSAELVAMDMPEGHPGHETLKQIFEASNLARDFVHKLRAMGQRSAPEFKAVRLQQVIEECLQILRTIIPDKVEVIAQMNPDCPCVNADSAQLNQAILDLCLHSWHGFADRRGQIKISLNQCALSEEQISSIFLSQSGSYVCLTIEDDGPGMEKSACQNIFHPFRNRRAGGTKIGLELFLVREVIQGHQGDIFVESEPGHGQKFCIYLPIAD